MHLCYAEHLVGSRYHFIESVDRRACDFVRALREIITGGQAERYGSVGQASSGKQVCGMMSCLLAWKND